MPFLPSWNITTAHFPTTWNASCQHHHSPAQTRPPLCHICCLPRLKNGSGKSQTVISRLWVVVTIRAIRSILRLRVRKFSTESKSGSAVFALLTLETTKHLDHHIWPLNRSFFRSVMFLLVCYASNVHGDYTCLRHPQKKHQIVRSVREELRDLNRSF